MNKDTRDGFSQSVTVVDEGQQQQQQHQSQLLLQQQQMQELQLQQQNDQEQQNEFPLLQQLNAHHGQPQFDSTDNIVQLGHYRIEKTIGQGSFGKVKLARDQRTNELVRLFVQYRTDATPS